MIVLKWVFPVSLAVLAIVHLVSCWRGDDDLRKPTKVALMPVVALAYLAFARQPSLWVVAGLLFGCLGDLFLLWPLKKKFFALGTSSFFLGHVCYLIFIYTHYVIRISWIWIVVVCVIYAAGAAFVYANSRRNIPRALRPLLRAAKKRGGPVHTLRYRPDMTWRRRLIVAREDLRRSRNYVRYAGTRLNR